MSSPFRIRIYNNDELVDTRHGNFGWMSPTNVKYAETIIDAFEAKSGLEKPADVEWTHFVCLGRVYFKEDYEQMVKVVSLIKSFDIADFSMELKQ